MTPARIFKLVVRIVAIAGEAVTLTISSKIALRDRHNQPLCPILKQLALTQLVTLLYPAAAR
jgi:hypothetical protein